MNTGRKVALVAVVVVLAGAFVLAQGSGDEGSSAQTRTSAGEVTQPGTTQEAAPAVPAPHVETIRIRESRPVGGARTLRFENGDTIRLRFASDTATAVHIHGYDRELEVPAGGTARTSLKAEAEGIFEIEDHDSDALLAKLEVRP